MRGRADFDIASWSPSFHPAAVWREDGSIVSTFYEDHALVTVFSYPGGQHGEPFTTVEAYYHDRLHKARLPRFYRQRWHRRLSREFDWRIALPE